MNIKKVIYLIVAAMSFVLGIVGIFLPVLPTTPLLILTSICLLKSSDKLNEKFMETKVYEKYVKEFHEKGGMTLKSKLMIIVPVSLILLIMFLLIENSIMRMVIILLFLIKITVFCRINTIKR